MAYRLSIERLVFGHNLLSNTCPKGLVLGEFNKRDLETPRVMERFGLFESATPNFATYYPDLKKEDLEPKDEDFVYPIFRALSEVIVRPFAPIDFGMNGVLKASMPKLVGQTIYPNHEALIGNELGSVLDVEWQDSYKSGNTKIPAGFNARLKIDGKARPQIARGVMMDPPSIHSTSVTVEFEWEKSHNFSDEEFYNKLGTFDEKGDLIKRNVTKVRNYHEISLVSHGADAFAQKVGKDGKIVNPGYAAGVYKFSAEDAPGTGTKLHFFSYKETESFSTTPTTILNNNNNNTDKENLTNTEMNKAQLISLLVLAGMIQGDLEKLSEPELQTKLSDFINQGKKDKDSLTSLQSSITEKDNKITELQTSLTAKETEITTLKADSEVGKAALVDIRTEVSKLYTLSCGDKAVDASMMELIAKADYNTSKAFLSQYQRLADEKFQASCKDCGSHNVSRMSAASKGQGEGQGGEQPANLTDADVSASLMKEFHATSYLGAKEETEK
jgi:hypothetical protein